MTRLSGVLRECNLRMARMIGSGNAWHGHTDKKDRSMGEKNKKNLKGKLPSSLLSRRRDLNPRPADYESAAIPLSHGGALPHNIDLCANKICVWWGWGEIYEYPRSVVTLSAGWASFAGEIVPNLPS